MAIHVETRIETLIRFDTVEDVREYMEQHNLGMLETWPANGGNVALTIHFRRLPRESAEAFQQRISFR